MPNSFWFKSFVGKNAIKYVSAICLACFFLFMPFGNLSAQSSATYDFNTTGDLASKFTGVGAVSSVTQSTNTGISATGAVKVPLSDVNAVFTTKQSYSNGGVGAVYTFSTFFKSEGNSGYGGIGFTNSGTSTQGTYANAAVGLGISVHGGGFVWNNNSTYTSGSWNSGGLINASISDLLNNGSADKWYKIFLTIEALASSQFKMTVEVWPASSTGTLLFGTASAKHTITVTNTNIANANSLYTYFAFAGTRITNFDNYSINLLGSTIVEAGAPIVNGDAAINTTTATSVDVTGNVTDSRGASITDRGFVYGTASSPTISNTKYSIGTGTGAFSGTISGLAAGVYYFRPFATNANGTSYGVEKSLTIVAPAPSITSFSPALAGNGETVIINGTNFTGATAVKFGGVAATSFVVNSATKITAIVGSAHSGTVFVETPGGTYQVNDFLYKVLEYKFENNVLDATEANLDGTIKSYTSGGTSTYNAGVNGKAINLDGKSYVDLPLNLIRGLGANFTISVMFNTTVAGAILGYSNWDVGTTKPSVSASEWIPILMVRSDGKLQGTLWTTANTALKAISSFRVDDGNWHKVDFSATANSVTIYIDGTQAGTISGAAVASLNMQFNQLGKGYTEAYDDPNTLTSWSGFNGALDNFLIIDKGVTATQLTENTSSASSISYPSKNILATGSVVTIAPSVVGSGINSFSVTPSLPTGLTLNSSTGVITGTPTTITAAATYTVTGTKTSGTVTSSIVISTVVPATITTTGILKSFTACSGCAITPQHFTVAGTSLSDDVIINAPEGFEVANAVNGTYATSLTLQNNAGSLAATDVFVKLSNNATTASTGTISIETSAGITQTITVTTTTDNSLNFDGANDYVAINNPIFTNGQSNFTIEAWVKPNAASMGSNYYAILGAEVPNYARLESRSPTIYICKSGKIHFDSYEYNTTNRYNFETTEVLLSQDKWSHIAIVKNGLLYTLYIDGVSKYSMAAPAQVTATENYKIGANDNYFSGGLDEVRFWGIAKTATEINENMTRELVGTETGLLTYLNFNQGTIQGANTGITTLNKLGSVNLTATLTNFPLTTGASSNFVTGFMPQITGSTTINAGANSTLTNGLEGGIWTSANTAIATVDANTGVVTGVAIGSTAITYTICSKAASINITITSAVTAPSNLSYSATNVTATKGTAITNITPTISGSAATYSISPALPAGLTLNTSTGVISGTPTALAALATYTITATNTGGTTTSTIELGVNDVAPSNLSYSATNVTATKGTAITSITPAISGGAATYSISPALPAGLTLNTSTGVISGTPTVLAALATYTITATNTGGTTTSTIELGVNDVAPSNLTYSSSNVTATKGTAITSITPTISGGAATYSISPALPAGLTLNTSTGVISGTPTALTALATYTITATNTGGTTTSTIELGVNDVAPSVLTYASITTPPSYGAPFTVNAPTSNGGTVTSYSISPALPAGLSFNISTGEITGTATEVVDLTTYTITATNSGGSTTSTISFGINKAILTVTAADATRCFAATDPAFTYTITGYVNGDNESAISTLPVVTTSATSSSVAGDYATIASGAVSTKYDFVYVDGVFVVKPLPVGTVASTTDFVCNGSTQALTITGGATYIWYKDGVAISGASTGTVNITTAGVYNAKLISALGCEAMSTNSLTMKLYTSPVADFTSQYYCIDKPVYLTNKSTFATAGTVKYLWEDGAGYTSTANSPTFIYTSAGNKTIKLTVTPDNCPALKHTISKVITIETPTPAVRYNTVDAIVRTAINLSGRTIANTTSYLWSPSIYLLDARTQFPTAVLEKETSFTLQTTVASSCVTVDTVLVRMFDGSDVFLPSVFSPNGDGINDQLKINLVFMNSVAYFRVYDKYNSLVFETKDKLATWDGTFNGTPLPVDTYFWVVSGTDFNGMTINKTGAFVMSK